MLTSDCVAVLEPDSTESFRDTIGFEFPSRKELIDDIIDDIESYLRETEPDMLFTRLAIEEALINAIEHGNKSNHFKTVYLEVERRNKSCRITIRDQGRGFDYNMVRDPFSEERFGKRRGRGIFLMRKTMDEVIYSRNGSEVTLIKNL